MTTSEDILARHAAVLLRSQRAVDVADAIDQVLGDPALPAGPRPRLSRIRKHLELLDQARDGMEVWTSAVRARRRQVEQVLAMLAHFFDPMEVRVAGRAAEGRIDPGDRVHLRFWTPLPLTGIVEVLEHTGPLELGSRRVRPEVASGQGRLSTIRLMGEEVDIELTVCPSRDVVVDGRHLVTARRVPLCAPDAFAAVCDGP